jgi:hypothetical protein
VIWILLVFVPRSISSAPSFRLDAQQLLNPYDVSPAQFYTQKVQPRLDYPMHPSQSIGTSDKRNPTHRPPHLSFQNTKDCLCVRPPLDSSFQYDHASQEIPTQSAFPRRLLCNTLTRSVLSPAFEAVDGVSKAGHVSAPGLRTTQVLPPHIRPRPTGRFSPSSFRSLGRALGRQHPTSCGRPGHPQRQ